MVDFFVIIVLYNERLNESAAYSTIKSAAERSNYHVSYLVADNSTNSEIKELNRESSQGFTYVDMQGNKGLPAAYNQAICKIDKSQDNWIIISDQDTKYGEDYFTKIVEAIRDPDVKAIAPKVENRNGVMSPLDIYNRIHQ